MKSNKKFMALSALGIIFVLDDHSGWSLNFFSNIFPYNSFFMPMFVFISGYFFKYENIKSIADYIIKKTRNFLVPYFKYNIIFLFITMFLDKMNIVHWTYTKSLKEFITISFTYGTPVDVSSASWFVIMLFGVVVFYAIIRKLFDKIWNDIVALIIYSISGAITVYFCHKNLIAASNLLIAKILFFSQFYQLGVCYKKYFEKRIDEIKDMYIYISTIVINCFLLILYGRDICFNTCASMNGFITDNIFLPLITSVTAILFWLTVSKRISLVYGDSKFLNFISDNTFLIMVSHLFYYNILNGIVAILGCEGFSLEMFSKTAWYSYVYVVPETGIIYILFSLFFCWIIHKIAGSIKKILRGL